MIIRRDGSWETFFSCKALIRLIKRIWLIKWTCGLKIKSLIWTGEQRMKKEWTERSISNDKQIIIIGSLQIESLDVEKCFCLIENGIKLKSNITNCIKSN